MCTGWRGPVGEGFSHTCILLLCSLWSVLVHGWVVVGGLLGGPMHGILRMLSIWVLCQVAGCISNVVHATCNQNKSWSNSDVVRTLAPLLLWHHT